MINKIQFLLLSLGLLVLTVPSYGQDNFQPGYVLPTAGDTLYGQIQTVGLRRSQRECLFRAGDGQALVSYTPTQLRGYGLTGGAQFRRGRVVLAVPDTTSAIQFREVLVPGLASLLYALDDKANPHFYLQMAGRPEAELKQVQRRIQQDGRTFNQTVDVFHQTLLQAFSSDCPALTPDIERLRFSEASLTGIVRRYNSCATPAGQAVATVTPAKKSHANLSLLVGAAVFQKMVLSTASGQSPQNQYNVAMTASASPTVGLQLTLHNSRLSKPLGFTIGAVFQRHNYQGMAKNSSQTFVDHVKVAYGADFISIPFGLRYDFSARNTAPFLEAALSANVRLNERRNDFTPQFSNPATPPQAPRVLFQGAYRHMYGVLVGAGIAIHRTAGHEMALRVRYELQNGISPYTGVNDNISTGTVLLSYALAKL